MSIAIHIALFAASLGVLAMAADRVVDSVLLLARRWRIPNAVAGATIAAAATSSPELGTNLFSVLAARGDESGVAVNIGLGSIAGSAVFNLTVIVGVVILARPIVASVALRRDTVVHCVAAAVLLGALLLGPERMIGRVEAAGLLVVYAGYLVWLVRDRNRHAASVARDEPDTTERSAARAVCILLGAIAVIAVSCHFLVDSTRYLATAAGTGLGLDPVASGTLISLLVVAAATSIPDALTSLAAARGGHADLAIGNAIGSNTFDLLVCVGAPGLALGGAALSPLVMYTILYVLAASVLTFWLMSRRLTKTTAIILLTVYAVFVIGVVGLVLLA